VLAFREPIDGITDDQLSWLSRLAADSGLGVGTLPQQFLHRLTAVADDAVAVLDAALATTNLADREPAVQEVRTR